MKESMSPDIFETTVIGLSPFTCYKASVEAVNGVGPSGRSRESNEFHTLEEGKTLQ